MRIYVCMGEMTITASLWFYSKSLESWGYEYSSGGGFFRRFFVETKHKGMNTLWFMKIL